MEKEVSKNYKVNCMFLGQSGVGKSSIIRRLLGEDFNEDITSTVGLDIKFFQPIKFENQDEDNSTISINIWDTAGQEKHQACIKGIIRRADIIIFVRDNVQENFEYWFKFVEDLIDINSIKVFYCLNKTDLMSTEQMRNLLNELEKKDRIKKHRATIQCVSSKTYEGIYNLERLLKEKSQDIISKGLQRHNYMIKIIVIGPVATGKSSLIERIIDGDYTERKNSTTYPEQKFTKVDLKNNSYIQMCYYDTCGQECFISAWINYLDNADIIIFVNNKDEIKANISVVKGRILLSKKKIICCINKIDLTSDVEKKKVLNNFKLENRELENQPIFLVSAKTSEGIEELKKKINDYSMEIIDKIIDSSNETKKNIELTIDKDNKTKNDSKIKRKKCC